MIQQGLTILIVAAVYLLVIALLAFSLKKLRIPAKFAIVVACLVFGAGAGLLTAYLWPDDVSVLVNLPASFFGDWLYRESIRYMGDPSSPQAHYTIPWLLRVPQVYVLASILFWLPAGAIVQLAYNRLTRRKAIE